MPKKKSFLSEEIPIWLLIVIIGIIIIPMHFGITKYYNAQLNEVADEFCQARSYEQVIYGKEIFEDVRCYSDIDDLSGFAIMVNLTAHPELEFQISTGYPANTFWVIYDCCTDVSGTEIPCPRIIKERKQIPFTEGIYKDGKFTCYGFDERIISNLCDTPEGEIRTYNHEILGTGVFSCLGFLEKSQNFCFKNQEWIRCD